MQDEIHIGVIGAAGNIGAATLRYIDDNFEIIKRKTGYTLIVDYVYPGIRDGEKEAVEEFKKSSKYVKPEIAGSAEQVIDYQGSEIIVEVTGADEAARDYILESFKAGKSVASPNKLVIAKYMRELFDGARKHGQEIGFETSVMAGVPVINPLRDNTDLARYHLGIINGTSNHVLTKMYGKKSFEDAFADAQDIGAAEPGKVTDFSLQPDVNGRDAANKNIILTALLYGAHVPYVELNDRPLVSGIHEITERDLQHAEIVNRDGRKYVIKMLAKGGIVEKGKVEFGVYPFLIDENHPLSNVDGTFNALYVDFENKGPQLFQGKGAEPGPTSAALVDDIIITTRRKRGNLVHIPYLDRGIEVIDPLDVRYKAYLRITAVDRAGTLSKISGILGDKEVSIEEVFQKNFPGNSEVDIVMETHGARVGDILKAVEEIDELTPEKKGERDGIIRGKTLFMRIQDQDI